MTETTTLGAWLRSCRQSAGMSQEQLAERAGLSIRAVRNLERGCTHCPHVRSLHRIADALALRGEARGLFAAAGRRPADRAPVGTAVAPELELTGTDAERLVPRQLPGPVRQFIGRDGELALLTGLLDHADAGPPGLVIVTIGGMAGVGKTALAVHWAHLAAGRFPDGQLYVNLRGFDPSGKPVPSAEAVRGFLDVLGVPAEQIPAGLDAQAALYRSLLSGKRMLVLLDNARDAGQVRPLLPGSPGCLVVVTSRFQLAPLAATDGAHQLTLGVLSGGEARGLLAQRLGAARLAAEPEPAAELAGLCARLPLALAIVAARASARPGFRLGVFAEELKDVRRRLDALETGDGLTSVRAVFSWSLGSLPAPAARMFALLGLHPGPDITIPAAASLAGLPLPDTRRALGELAAAHLIIEHAPARFAMHDLLRTYAAEQAASYDADDQRAAMHRMLDHYLHTLHAADRLLYPGRDEIIVLAPRAGAMPERLASAQQAQAWLRAERRVLLAAVAQAATLSFDNHAWQIACCLAMFLDLGGYWPEWATTQRVALASAERAGDARAQARIHLVLSHACMRLASYSDAQTHLEHAFRLSRQTGDRIGQARVHVAFSLVFNREGRHREAFGHAQQGLILYWSVGYQPGLAQALNAMGWSEAHLAPSKRAVACAERAARLHHETGNTLGEAEGWDSLGYAHHQLGEHCQAISCYERAIACHRRLACRHEEAVTRARLGDVHLASGHDERARDAWNHAMAVFESEHHASAGAVQRRIDYLGNGARCRAGQAGEPIDAAFFEPVF